MPRALPFHSLAAMASALILAAPAFGQAPVAPAAPVAPVGPRLAEIPGVTVKYYDVTGLTPEAINASIIAVGPKNSAGQVTPATAQWTIGASLKKETKGTECKVTGATATFKADVMMPRLVNAEPTPAPVAEHWQKYIVSVEQEQAARLLYPKSRLAEVEQAILASSCDGAGAAMNRVVADIKAQAAARAAAAAAAAAAAPPAPPAPAK